MADRGTGRAAVLDMVPVPDDVLQIPQVVQQVLEFDLTKLNDDAKVCFMRCVRSEYTRDIEVTGQVFGI